MTTFIGKTIDITEHTKDKVTDIRGIEREDSEELIHELLSRSIRDGYGSQEGQRAYVVDELRIIVQEMTNDVVRIVTIFKDTDRRRYGFLSEDFKRIKRREKRSFDQLLYVKNLELSEALIELGDALKRHTRAKNPHTVSALEEELAERRAKLEKINGEISKAMTEYERRLNVIKTLIWEGNKHEGQAK